MSSVAVKIASIIFSRTKALSSDGTWNFFSPVVISDSYSRQYLQTMFLKYMTAKKNVTRQILQKT